MCLCIVASCAAPALRVDIPFSDQTFQSFDGLLSGRVPKGWFASTDYELAPHLSAWLTREDYGATLAIQEIFVDPEAAHRIDKDGLSLLAELSFRLKQAEESAARIAVSPHEFSLEGKYFCRYEYVSAKGEAPRGVVVFRIRDKYFESVAIPTKDTFTVQQLELLFNVQRAVLASLKP